MKAISQRKRQSYREFLYILPFIATVAVFSYYPLYGWFYSFFDFRPPKPLDLNSFVGLKWFVYLLDNPVRQKQIFQVLLNTLALSGLNIIFAWLPMLFAVFLNEIKNVPFRKVVQTVTTIPNFISWVLVYSIAYNLFCSTGMANTLLQQLGLINVPIQFLQSPDHIWFKMWMWGSWKNLGWTAIMYMAAISGIDEELNEAARVDGATRMQIIRHITIPCLLPTFFVLVMLQIANFLSNGMEQYYVFQNSFNKNTIQGLDLYVYNLAMGSGSYSVSTALSMLKSLISVALLCGVNGFSKLIRGESFI